MKQYRDNESNISTDLMKNTEILEYKDGPVKYWNANWKNVLQYPRNYITYVMYVM